MELLILFATQGPELPNHTNKQKPTIYTVSVSLSLLLRGYKKCSGFCVTKARYKRFICPKAFSDALFYLCRFVFGFSPFFIKFSCKGIKTMRTDKKTAFYFQLSAIVLMRQAFFVVSLQKQIRYAAEETLYSLAGVGVCEGLLCQE
ncbi:MAG: hypothetical protein MR963_05245 [Bacteroidales bacterium]|nr:hypothetical protein [Bacteroidales bacterium]